MPFDPYAITTPCSNCPFRTDIVPYLFERRVREIEQATGFTCHKTLDLPEMDRRQCAGYLILREKMGEQTMLMQVMLRMDVYDPTRLDMQAPVYNSWDEMVAAQRRW